MGIILKHALRSMRANKGQAIVILITVIIATIMIFTAFSVNGLFYNILMVEGSRASMGADLLVGSGGVGDPFSPAVIREVMTDKNGTVDPRIDYTEFYFKSGAVMATGTKNIEVLIEATDLTGEAGLSYLTRHNFEAKEKYSGTTPLLWPSVIIGERMAKMHNISIGDTVQLVTATQKGTFSVEYIAKSVGLFSSPQSLNVLIDISHLPVGGLLSGLVTGVYFKFKDPSAYGYYADAFASIDPNLVVGRADNSEWATATAQSNTLLYEVGSVFIIGLMALILYTSYIILARKRATETVLFKAAGATPAMATFAILLEAFLYGLIGSVAGVILGALILKIAVSAFLPLVTTPIKFGFLQFAVGILAGIVISCGSAFVPVLNIAKKPVRELLSGGVKGVKYAPFGLVLGLFVALFGLVLATFYVGGGAILWLSVALLAVLAGLIAYAVPYLIRLFSALFARLKLRDATSLAGISLKRNAPTHTVSLLLASVIAFAFMCVSVIDLVITAVTPYNTRFSGDVVVKVAEDITLSEASALSDRLASASGTQSVSYFRVFPMTVDLGTSESGATDANVYGIGSATALRDMTKGNIPSSVLDAFSATKNGAVINAEIAEIFGLKVGDSLLISTLLATDTENVYVGNASPFTVVGIENTVTEYDRVVFVHLESLYVMQGTAQVPLTADTVYLATAQKGTTAEELFMTYGEILRGSNTLSYAMFFDDWAFGEVAGLEGVASIMRLIQFMVIGIAFLSLANIIIVTFIDRKNEYKIYRFSGLSDTDFTRLAMGESAVLTCSGGLLGLISAFTINRVMPSLGRLVEKFIRYPAFPLSALIVTLTASAVFVGAWLLIALANRKGFAGPSPVSERILNG